VSIKEVGADFSLTLHPPGKMAKLLCMLAWAGAATAAPTSEPIGWNPSGSGRLGGGSEEALLATVMGSLGPSINSAIAAALGGAGLSSGAPLTRSRPVTTFEVFLCVLDEIASPTPVSE